MTTMDYMFLVVERCSPVITDALLATRPTMRAPKNYKDPEKIAAYVREEEAAWENELIDNPKYARIHYADMLYVPHIGQPERATSPFYCQMTVNADEELERDFCKKLLDSVHPGQELTLIVQDDVTRKIVTNICGSSPICIDSIYSDKFCAYVNADFRHVDMPSDEIVKNESIFGTRLRAFKNGKSHSLSLAKIAVRKGLIPCLQLDMAHAALATLSHA